MSRGMALPNTFPGPVSGAYHRTPPERRAPTRQEEEAAQREAELDATADALTEEFRADVQSGNMSVEEVVAIAKERTATAQNPQVEPIQIERLVGINAEIAQLKSGSWASRTRDMNAKIGLLRQERAKILDAAEAEGAIEVRIVAERTDYNLKEHEWKTKPLRNKPIRR